MAEYKEFPRCLYKGADVSKVVHDEDEKKAALKAGWSLTPVYADVEIAPEPVAETEPVESVSLPEADDDDFTPSVIKKRGRKAKGD